ncbi:MAG TPA: phosphate ABC transporter permease PstA [Polyangiaceae bacterium]|jgi:phosphate transport system permease protein
MAAATTIPPESSRLALKPNAGDRALVGATTLATVIILAMLVIVLADVVIGGSHVLSWEFLTQAPTDGMTKGGIFPAIFGTVALTFLMTIVAVPAGVATAVYLTEYAPPDSRLARAIRVCIANLAGVPSIVFGLFGLGFFIATVGRAIDVAAYGGQPTYAKPSLIWAALTLAILTLPVVVVSTEEALRAVPRELRDGSLALGATKFQTVTRVVLPQALGGILTGGILAVSRGAGEVAPIMFTGAAYFLPYLPTHLNDQFMNLGYHVYVLATQSPDVDKTKPLLYGTVLVLLLLTFVLNLAAIAVRARFRRRLLQA